MGWLWRAGTRPAPTIFIALFWLCPATQATTGWQDIPNTTLQSVCPPNRFQPPGGGMPDPASASFSDGCFRILTSWSSATVDTRRNRLLFRGDGHDGVNDNAVFSLDLVSLSNSNATMGYTAGSNGGTIGGCGAGGGGPCATTSNGGSVPAFTRLMDPSIYDPSINCAPNTDGTPLAMQTYGAWIYMPKTDKVFFHGFGDRCVAGTDGGNVWIFDPAALTWAKKAAMSPGTGSGSNCVLDTSAANASNPADVVLCILSNKQLVSYDAGTDVVTNLTTWGANWNNGDGINSAATPVLDPIDHTIYSFGQGPWGPDLYAINLANPSEATKLTSLVNGCDDLMGNNYPSLVWDPTINKIVGYVPMTAANPGVANNEVIVFDTATLTCVTQTSGGGPAAYSSTLAGQGTFGHFNYVPALNEYVLVNNQSLDTYVYNLSATPIPCTILPTSLPAGTVGTAYSQSVTAVNCGASPSWSILSGSEPSGLSGCNGVTGSSCMITGTPTTTAGSPVSFTIQVMGGGLNVASHAYSLTINPAGSTPPPPPPPPTPAGPINGLGASYINASGDACLDKDGDGYGVGPACLGPDADDNDPLVQTAAQGIARHGGTLNGFLSYLGYNPAHIWYLDAVNGNDANSCEDNITTPCKTWGHIAGSVTTNQMVIFRAGTYTEQVTPPSGTPGNPVILMAYPGEVVTMDASAFSFNSVFKLFDTSVQSAAPSYITIDGFRCVNTTSGACVAMESIPGETISTGVTIRHLNARDAGVDANIDCFDSSGLLIEDNVLHDPEPNNGQHEIYCGSHYSFISNNLTIRRNILYNTLTGYPALQINGRCAPNCVVTQNLIYGGSNGAGGISLLEGVKNATLSDNVVFSMGGSALVISNYDGDCNAGGEQICPYDQTGNTIENNTFWGGNNQADGSATAYSGLVYTINNTTSQSCAPNPAPCGNLGSQIFRNNIFVSKDGSHLPFAYADCKTGTGPGEPLPCVLDDANQRSYYTSSTFVDNILYNLANGPAVAGLGVGNLFYSETLSQLQTNTTGSHDNLNTDPRLVAVSDSDYNQPIKINLQLASNSPGLRAGTLTGVPTYDIRGAPRPNPPSLGAYDTGAIGAPPPTSPPTNPPTGGGNPPPVTVAPGSTFAVHVYPNPWRSDKHAAHPNITFAGLATGTTIKIFTVSGHEAKELRTDGPSLPWDLTNNSGDKVASGIYTYLITDSAGDKVRGKVAVIK